ncbi:MAG: orc1/cdc6 family replication initiation protein [Methanobrevibacter sp.]|jgi:cell division control protein 6|nr:orc1/cdc6 family replication initiation protein [Methanobrevibacter sp.]
MGNMFDEIMGRDYVSIFKDKKYLDHKYIPNNLPHRIDQIKVIAKYWIEALYNTSPTNITVFGKTGTGKTAAAKFAMKELKGSSNAKEVFVKTEYIRCTDYTTEYQVIVELCQRMGRDVPDRGWTKHEVMKAFRDIFRRNAFGKNMILIVVLDEIDVLLEKDGDGILYTLTRTENVSILSISNYVDFKKFIQPRVMSSLCDKEVVFPPYNAEQLIDILDDRAQMSFNQNTYDEEVIALCSALAARDEGDARYALDLLKTSGEIAEENGDSKILTSHVSLAKDKIEHNTITDILISLPIQQQRILEALLRLTHENEEITSGKLYDTYQEVCRGDTSVSYRRIFDLINQLELLGIISTNTISKGRGKGRTNIISLQCDSELIERNILSTY